MRRLLEYSWGPSGEGSSTDIGIQAVDRTQPELALLVGRAIWVSGSPLAPGFLRGERGLGVAVRSVWREWQNEDGTVSAILMFPESYSEKEALEEVGMDERGLVKTGERRFEADQTHVCEYQVMRKGVRQKSDSS